MFSVPRVNVIECDEGFSVEILGMTGLKYSEGDRSIHVDSELLSGSSGLAVFRDTIHHWDIPDQPELSLQEQERVVENIRRAYRFRGFEILVLNRSAS